MLIIHTHIYNMLLHIDNQSLRNCIVRYQCMLIVSVITNNLYS